MPDPSGYRFAGFVVSRRRRQVLRDGDVLPLIPRYFDLLVLLIERRQAVVTRREIFDLVWGDVIVSDGALTQAIRTLRRLLGDDPRQPRFIRTASRHGYSFVFAAVDVDDAAPREAGEESPAIHSPEEPVPVAVAMTALVDRLLAPASDTTLEEQRDVAQQLHALDTAAALRLLTARPGHADALALMRDTRWEVPGAGPVPLLGQREGGAAAWRLIRWRLHEALRITGRRWVQAAGGAASAGAAAGLIGGSLLTLAPGSTTPATAIPVLVVLGAAAGFAGAAGVGAGIASAEAVARSRRSAAIVCGGAFGGWATGVALQRIVSAILQGVFGLQVPIGGPFEGLCLGAAVAAGYAVSTMRAGGGIAAPRGPARWRAAAASGLAAGAAAVVLARAGFPLVGGIINAIAQASTGSHVALAPLGAWMGEPQFGPITQTLVAAGEGTLFGLGLAWGLTRRPLRRF